MTEARKLSSEEVWDSSVIFFMDEELEREIEAEVESLLEVAWNYRVLGTTDIDVSDIADFLRQKNNALDVILSDVGLSEENFKSIVLLLRKLRHTPDDFDHEWSMREIKSKIAREPDFALVIARLLVDGKRDKELKHYIPHCCLDMLNYREINGGTEAARRMRYKQSMIKDYAERKEQQVEGKILAKLEKIKVKHGLSYMKVHPIAIKAGFGLFAIPSFEDAWVVMASSFQEITSITQSIKVWDIISAYERVCHANSRYGENRAFVNFVDGGGWLARKRDLGRLVEHCHYFINLQHLDMLEAIVLKHVPEKYFAQDSL